VQNGEALSEQFQEAIHNLYGEMNKKFEHLWNNINENHGEVLQKMAHSHQQLTGKAVSFNSARKQKTTAQSLDDGKLYSIVLCYPLYRLLVLLDDSEYDSEVKVVPTSAAVSPKNKSVREPQASPQKYQASNDNSGQQPSRSSVNNQLVNTEEDLILKQKEFEIRNKLPKGNYYQDSSSSDYSKGGNQYKKHHNKKLFGKEFTVSGPSLQDIQPLQHKYLSRRINSTPNSNRFHRHDPNLLNSGAASVASVALYDTGNNHSASSVSLIDDMNDNSSIMTFDDDSSIVSRGPPVDLVQSVLNT
jgi:hypothetical protein